MKQNYFNHFVPNMILIIPGNDLNWFWKMNYFCPNIENMHEGDKKFKAQWEKTRNDGRIRYALIHGSIFGLIVFVVINLWSLKDQSFQDVFLSRRALDQGMTMVLAGILGYGTIKWWMNENIYKKIISRESAEKR
jgi:hypothetical protein